MRSLAHRDLLALPLDKIIVEPQHRADLGDLTELGLSIGTHGVLSPLAVTSEGVLLSGARRLEAAREMGLARVPVWRCEDLLQAKEALADALGRPEGQIPMPARACASLGNALEELHRVPGTSVRKLIAEALGMSEHAWQRLRIVAEAVESGELDPEVFEEIDEGGSPTPPWKALMLKREGKTEYEKPKQFDMNSAHNRKVAEGARARFSKAVGALDGYRQGLETLELHKVLAIASEEEIEGWRRILAKTMNTLKTVRAELQKEDKQ